MGQAVIFLIIGLVVAADAYFRTGKSDWLMAGLKIAGFSVGLIVVYAAMRWYIKRRSGWLTARERVSVIGAVLLILVMALALLIGHRR
jgi:hypothetical protein